jgi:hypothetical protein
MLRINFSIFFFLGFVVSHRNLRTSGGEKVIKTTLGTSGEDVKVEQKQQPDKSAKETEKEHEKNGGTPANVSSYVKKTLKLVF